MRSYLMTMLGISFIASGFACWLIGVGRVIKRTRKRHGIKNDWNYFIAPVTIPYSKFTQKDWLEIFGYLILCGILISIGSSVLR